MSRRRHLGWIVVGSLGLLGASCGADGAPATTDSRATVSTGSATEAHGIDSDEPCTAHVDTGEALARTPIHLDDLTHMVLTKDDLGGLPGFDIDPFAFGFADNDWFEYFEVQPPTTCDDLARHGRINGYSATYSASAGEGPWSPRVGLTVHLFWDEADASAWSTDYMTNLKAEVDASNGDASMTVEPAPELGTGGLLVTHVHDDGASTATRTWAVFQRGPIVAWVVDLHAPSTPAIDVLATAKAMASRTETVIATAQTRERAGLDAAQFMSVPLRADAYGTTATGLTWDEGFGGCMDPIEADQVLGGPVTPGRRYDCTAMFSAADSQLPSSTIVRVFSRIIAYDTADDASKALAASLAALQGEKTTFDIGNLADERAGVKIAGDDQFSYRGVVRAGEYVLAVQISDRADTDHAAEIRTLAPMLLDRLQRRLAED